MSDRPLAVLLIVADPVMKLGLSTYLRTLGDVTVVAVLEEMRESFTVLERLKTPPSVVLCDVALLEGLAAIRDLQRTQVPILLLAAPSELPLVTVALNMGIAGYCLKGTPTPELLACLRLVSRGDRLGTSLLQARTAEGEIYDLTRLSPWLVLQHNLRTSGLRRIESQLQRLSALLERPDCAGWQRAILAGQRRELLSAHWLVGRILLPPMSPRRSAPWQPIPPERAIVPIPTTLALQNAVVDTLTARLQCPLRNLTGFPLEIDILREERRREFLYAILRCWDQTLRELRAAPMPVEQLAPQRSSIITALWQQAAHELLGRFYTLPNGDDVVATILDDRPQVQTDILDSIPQIPELLSHVLYQTPLVIDGNAYGCGTFEAMRRVEMLTLNLLIQVANGVMLPLLNHFAEAEPIKERLYDRQRLSSREIERFRNDLSWRYRRQQYFGEPQAIFESRYSLLTCTESGIRSVSVYAPRTEELQSLQGIAFWVTLGLELQDAIAPRLRAMLAFVGRGLVYVLTNVVGRGIGLIGRGILQGVGSALQDRSFGRSP
jgi:DNA-binding NarL/FixJ family response regulator